MIRMIFTLALHVCSYVHSEVHHHKLNIKSYVMKNIKYTKIMKCISFVLVLLQG